MVIADPAERMRLGMVAATGLGNESQGWLNQANQRALEQVIEHRQLSAVFQPILDFRARGYLGFEGLIRGPAGSPLHSPQALFGLAQACERSFDLERLCREIVFTEFARQRLPGRLFVNVSAPCLGDAHFLDGTTGTLLEKIGLTPHQIVIEITENRQVADFSILRDLLSAYRKAGYQIAVDDLGEGFSNLRMWSEVRPEFVKIDRHFISGIADDVMKFQLVRAIHELAEISHAQLIAEGIETEAEFATVRDLGIAFGQGYLIDRPAAQPERAPAEAVVGLIARSQLIVFPQASSQGSALARDVMTYVAPVSPEATNIDIYIRFENEPQLPVLPVVDADATPLGMINRHSLIDRFARPFRRELYGRKSCTLLMDASPLVVEHDISVQEVGQLLGRSAHHHMLDGFIVTERGRYIGIGSTQALMALITNMQINAARYANPLTQLPGNVPINEHIDRLIAGETHFFACYCDLDHFKPFNDTYGYRQGDQVIQFLGNALRKNCNLRLDFIGHVGGDDFVLLLQREDCQEMLQQILTRFDEGIEAFIALEHRDLKGYWGEDRRGQPVFHSLPSLSIGVVEVHPGLFHSHHEVSAAMSSAKKQAKKKESGSSLFIERRRSPSAPKLTIKSAGYLS
ncbi:MAG: GGDEF domain-containing protein [Rhodocyclaceae bacterium]|nr:GGDEF domain-containing protein [Rhodocyclaceae bacterium]